MVAALTWDFQGEIDTDFLRVFGLSLEVSTKGKIRECRRKKNMKSTKSLLSMVYIARAISSAPL
jgi:hypothetical protein